MDAILTSFKELYNKQVTGVSSVLIPKIQRAYAQGRQDKRATRTRSRFLDSIHNKIVKGDSLTLDFVYGKIELDKDGYSTGVLTPLDGQQRLTTLFLLYWFVAKHENKNEQDYSFLFNFSYDTRYSARDFCEKLISYTPESFESKLSAQIIDQSWFPLDWNNDATVSSMLTMLDSIRDKFVGYNDLWDKLENIRFYYQSIESLGQTDDVYIKMNSRGKPLTNFEHFKAELEKNIKDWEDAQEKVRNNSDANGAPHKEKLSDKVSSRIDVLWTDLLWPYKDNDNLIDDAFIRYFRFVCDVICYQSNCSPSNIDEFALLKHYFSGNELEINTKTLIKFFDCWLETDKEGKLVAPTKETLDAFFAKYTSTKHEPNKVKVTFGNLFSAALSNYADLTDGMKRTFKLPQVIYLYAFVLFRQHKSEISDEQFVRRLRIVNNLVLNSSDEISDNEKRVGGNRMPAILKQVESIIIDGKISDDIHIGEESGKINFNVNQLQEEKLKLHWTEINIDQAETLYQIEDHELLYGQISIIGLDNIDLFERFESLFNCDKDKIDCALLAQGSYYQRDNNSRIQIGSGSDKFTSSWKNLFHKSGSTGYDKTSSCLLSLLNQSETFTNEILDNIIHAYESTCVSKQMYDWRYYYIHYHEFRVKRYGKYTLYEDKPYEIVSLYAPQEESSNSKKLFLTLLGEVDKEYNGHQISNDGYTIYCDNSSYFVSDSQGNELYRLIIPQNNNIDCEDRIEKALHDQELMRYLR